ncbi:MAG: MoaD/ThiS family protein [Candidatus Thermoplasmatota archaeon]|jgi:molybdopterin synthase sulfur carrier subunit|uniref:MoaD/ThiS family protein n=1 Tax=Ferroplasma sp. TaxID=2591003 RepID=UPI0026130D66|nr:MoaD/ThiS family protein [Ferroplasma sp.]MCL4311963.1 MoaD/ThiS family protein [Candidatus Thermoplasmatota archaeon]
MRITVLYFARVRDITGTAQETFDISWGSMDELMEKIFSKYPELRNISNLLISVNNEYYSGIPLRENDRVAFFPPVSGG